MEPNVLSRRIEQLAALAGDEPDATGSRTAVASLRGELAGLNADLAALRGEVGSVRTDIDGLAGRITGSVAANRTETGTLSSRIADLVNRIDVVGVRVDEVKSDLPQLVREVRDGLALVPVRTGAKFDELAGKLGESIGTRVDAVAGEVRRTVAAALEREADNAAATRGLMSEARSALESRMAVVEDALDALSERLEALLRDGAHTTRDQLRELAGSLTGLEQRVDAASGEQVERIVARLQGVIEHRLDNFSAVLADATRTRNEQLRRELLDMLTRASSEQESTRNQVAVLADAVQLAAAEQVVATTALIGGTAASLAEVREDIQTELDDVAERLLVTVADLRAQQDAQAVSLEARADALQALAHAGAADRAERQHALDTIGERVAFSVNASIGSVQTALDDFNNRFGDATRSTHEALLDRLGEHHSTVTGRLADVAAATAGSTAASRDAGERLAALATSQEETRRSVEALQGDWPTRVPPARKAARRTQAQAGASTSDTQTAGGAVAAAHTGEVRSGPKARAAQKAAPRTPTKVTSVPVKPMKPVAETRAPALEAMPEVPSPATALEAVSAPMRPAPPAQPTSPTPPARRGPAPSATSGRPGAEELRRIFRRRKP